MKRLFIYLLHLVFLTCAGYSQESAIGTLKVTSLRDTIKYSFQSGLYLVVPDDSRTQGFPLINTQDFYYLGIEHVVTLRNVDTIYKSYEKQIAHYVLNIKFNQDGMTELMDFTKRYIGKKIGIMLDGKLIYVATIPYSIDSGEMTIHGNFSEKEVDILIKEIKVSINFQKQTKVSRNKATN